MSGNLRALYKAVPDEWKGGATNWYHGANKVAQSMAERFGTSTRAQAANIAAQSPQRQWDHNVEGSMRTSDIVMNHSQTPWNEGHTNAWHQPETGFGTTNPDWLPRYQEIEGKMLSEITDPQAAALWVRLHDRANAPDNFVHIVKPDGTFGDLLRKKAERPGELGDPESLQWGDLGAIGNSVKVLRDDSVSNISRSMGNAHKVRNFYNNIVSPDAGHDITIDTHAAAAALLRPLGSSNPEVSYALGSPVKKKPFREGPDPWPTTMNNAPAGVVGMYPLYAEAYRKVAQELGILPRELQSVTWEGIRGLYDDVDRKSRPLRRENSDLWKQVTDGTKTADDVRAQILKRGIRAPDWVGQ
jgi:hypothetical protein